MGSERVRRGRALALAAAAVAVALALLGGGPPRPAAAEAWWVPVGLRGQAVTTVVPAAPGLIAVAGGRAHCLGLPGGPAAPVCGRRPGHPPSGRWAIRDGRVVREEDGRVDPGSPDLGATAHLLAAPADLPGVVVAVAADGTVWRRDQAGGWGRSLLLLPAGLAAGPPRITGLAAFDASPLTTAVYLATDGYAVLVSTDGGDDWFRAAPGLPTGVLTIATDAATHAVYAGTRDGVWVHHLQAVPAPPVYPQQGLLARWLGIAGLAVASTLAAIAALARLARPPARS
jgi:hypothetical protein